MLKELLAYLSNRDGPSTAAVDALVAKADQLAPEPKHELEPHEKAHIELAEFLAADIQTNGRLWNDGWNNWLTRQDAAGKTMSLEITRDSNGNLCIAVQHPEHSRQWDRLAEKAQEILEPVVLEHIRARERSRMRQRSVEKAKEAAAVLAKWKLHVSA